MARWAGQHGGVKIEIREEGGSEIECAENGHQGVRIGFWGKGRLLVLTLLTLFGRRLLFITHLGWPSPLAPLWSAGILIELGRCHECEVESILHPTLQQTSEASFYRPLEV
jgi:hypothetical protein